MTNHIETRLSQAAFCYQHQQYHEAIKHYEAILQLAPKQIDALNGLGLCYAQLKAMEKTIKYFRLAIEQTQHDEVLFNNLGNAYKATGAYDKAIECYEKALSINQDYAQAHQNMGTLFTIKQDYPQALKHFREAVHLEPDFLQAHYNLGLLLLKQDALDAAATQFNNVLTLHPHHKDAHFYAGVLHLEANRLDEAEHHFQAVINLDNEHTNALVNLGVISLKRQKGQIAIDYFTKALAYNEHHIEARSNIAATFIHHDRFENALMHYDVLLQRFPNNIEYLYNAGVAQMALGHLHEAQDHFDHILRIESNHFPALNNLAAIHARLGNRSLAITFLRRAIAIKPDDTACEFMLNAMTGGVKQPKSSPAYVTHLFDNYAISYEKHMLDTLHYVLPYQLTQLLHQHPFTTNVSKALDLGCGTGLMGNAMKELSEHLTGVDLSPKMLSIASEKHVYDQLVESDLLTFLKETPDSYTLIIAADVLPYLGDLDRLFYWISQKLDQDGLFICSTEINENEPWVLQSNARFAHHEGYIKSLCEQHHLNITHQETCIARTQEENPVRVNIFKIQQNSN